MNRLSKKQVKLIKKLSDTYSLNEIVKRLTLSKSVIYYWYRKFVGRVHKPIILNLTLKEELGELIGIFSSDGNYIYQKKSGTHRIRIFLSSKQYRYSIKLKILFKKIFNRNGTIYKDIKNNMIVLNVYGKKIIEIFRDYIYWEEGRKTYTVRLLFPLKNYDKLFLHGFLKGLFYGDGWATKKNIGFGSVSYDLAMNFSNILSNFNIINYIYKNKKTYKKHKKAFYSVMVPSSEKIKFLQFIDYNKNAPFGNFRRVVF